MGMPSRWAVWHISLSGSPVQTARQCMPRRSGSVWVRGCAGGWGRQQSPRAATGFHDAPHVQRQSADHSLPWRIRFERPPQEERDRPISWGGARAPAGGGLVAPHARRSGSSRSHLANRLHHARSSARHWRFSTMEETRGACFEAGSKSVHSFANKVSGGADPGFGNSITPLWCGVAMFFMSGPL